MAIILLDLTLSVSIYVNTAWHGAGASICTRKRLMKLIWLFWYILCLQRKSFQFFTPQMSIKYKIYLEI
jgi:uncharacterized membrane protein (DUF106 family)